MSYLARPCGVIGWYHSMYNATDAVVHKLRLL